MTSASGGDPGAGDTDAGLIGLIGTGATALLLEDVTRIGLSLGFLIFRKYQITAAIPATPTTPPTIPPARAPASDPPPELPLPVSNIVGDVVVGAVVVVVGLGVGLVVGDMVGEIEGRTHAAPFWERHVDDETL